MEPTNNWMTCFNLAPIFGAWLMSAQRQAVTAPLPPEASKEPELSHNFVRAIQLSVSR